MPGVSYVHRLDPRTKLMILLFLIPTLFRTDDLTGLVLFSAFVLFLISLSSFSIFFVLRGVVFFFWIFAFTCIFHLFFTPGDSIYPFPVGVIDLTWQGLHRGTIVFARLALLIVVANIFTLTTSPAELTKAIENLLKPLKFVGVKTDELALMIMLIIRFIPVLKFEAEKVLNAQKARGIDFDNGSLPKRARRAATVLGPLFTNVFDRTDGLVTAMICRGFGQGIKKESLKELAFKKRDFAAIATVVIFFVIMAIHY